MGRWRLRCALNVGICRESAGEPPVQHSLWVCHHLVAASVKVMSAIAFAKIASGNRVEVNFKGHP